MDRLLVVCLGGAFGSGARYLLSGWVTERCGDGFPFGTLSVNVLGSFLMGVILRVATTSDWISPTAKLALTVGVLGGFTTYSSFNAETLANLERGAIGVAGANVLATLLACGVAGLLGNAAGGLLAGN